MRERLARRLDGYVSPAAATVGPHGLFRYPAKYLPQIAAGLLAETEGPVLDPFADSGTTLLEASRLGRPSAGLDLNPLAVLVCRAKAARVEPDAVLDAGERALARAKELDPALPSFRNRDYWFPLSSLRPLSRLRAAIDGEPDGDLRRILLTVFLSNVKACSNASTYQYKLTRSREPDPVTGAGVGELFKMRVRRAADRFAAPSPGPHPQVLGGDARHLPFPDGHFGAVVTHPPYSISFDFVRSFKIYLWWLDPARDTVALDRMMTGNQRRNVGEPPRLGIPEIDDRVDRVLAADTRDGLAVAHFFADLERVLAECLRVLALGGRLALYMGDSQARWVPLDAPGNLARLAERLGFRLLVRHDRQVPAKATSSIRRIHEEVALIFAK